MGILRCAHARCTLLLMSSVDLPPRLVGVIPGNPFDRLTWSGLSHHFFSALASTGALVGAVDSRGLPLLDYAARGMSFSRDRSLWRQRYMLSPLRRAAMSWTGGRRVRRLDRSPDGLVQVGAWYRFDRMPGLRPRLRCSFHDGNLAVHLRRPDARLDPGSLTVRRALDSEKRLYDRLDLIFPMSEWLRRSFIEDFEQDPAKVIAVGAGANIHNVPTEPKRRFDPPRLMFVGRDFERKGGLTLLRAFRKVHAQWPEAELWIVGPERLPETVPGVRAFGRIMRNTQAGEEAIDRLYRRATTYVMPSVYEPFGVAFLEAMAYRLPCVGANCCAMPEIIDEGSTGYLIPPSDSDALADCLLRVIEDPARAQAMGEAGYRRFSERYTWVGVAGRIVALVRDHAQKA